MHADMFAYPQPIWSPRCTNLNRRKTEMGTRPVNYLHAEVVRFRPRREWESGALVELQGQVQ